LVALLEENRKLERFLTYLEVTDRTSGDLVGHAANIHQEGLLLISKTEIELSRDISIWAELPGDQKIESKFPLVINGLWNETCVEPDHYKTGFKIVKPSLDTITEINKIIEQFSPTSL